MKRFSIFAAIFLLVVLTLASIAWVNRKNLLSHYLAKELHVPVTLNAFEIDKKGASLEKLHVATPPLSQSTTSFAAETIRIDTTLDELFADPLFIEKIEIDHIFVGIEFYDAKGTKSNWDIILREDQKKKSNSNYLIQTLVLRDLTVEVTQANGNVKRYPTIPQMEFHNISNETGFPIDEIEKAIFNLMMKNLFQNLPINQLLKGYLPSWALP